MRIDVHCHLFPEPFYHRLQELDTPFEFATDPLGQTIIRYKGARFQRVHSLNWDVERRLAAMDEAGVDVQVLSLSAPNVYWTDDENSRDLARLVNDALAEVCQRYPDRFRAFASLPMNNPDYAIAELHRAIHELGMCGVILGTNIAGQPLNAPRFEPVYEELNRLKVPVFLHPMPPLGAEQMTEFGLAPLVGFIFETTLAVTRMVFSGIFERYPDITLIVPHLGAAIPYLFGRIENGYRAFAECRQHISQPPSTYLKRFYYDTISFHPPALRCAIETVGADHLMLGTDYPHVIGSVSRSIESVEALGLSEEETQAILGGTAQKILGIGEE